MIDFEVDAEDGQTPEDAEKAAKQEALRQRRLNTRLFHHGRWSVFRLDSSNIVLTGGDVLDVNKFGYYPNLPSAMTGLLNQEVEEYVRSEAGNWVRAFTFMKTELLAAIQGQSEITTGWLEAREASDTPLNDEEAEEPGEEE
jgi:hypothetical protein